MKRDEIAEQVGFYFGLQRAGNISIIHDGHLNEGVAFAVNELRRRIDIEAARVVAKLPPGTIDRWPNVQCDTVEDMVVARLRARLGELTLERSIIRDSHERLTTRTRAIDQEVSDLRAAARAFGIYERLNQEEEDHV